jgi:methylglyoxal synthase
MQRVKNIALVAHDNRKGDLTEWVLWNYKKLADHELICTGTTGKLVEETMIEKLLGRGSTDGCTDSGW